MSDRPLKCWRRLSFDREEQYEDYIEAMTKNLSNDSTDHVSLNNRGMAHWEMGREELALQDLRMACQLAFWEHVPFLNLSDVLLKAGDLNAALEAASSAIVAAPGQSSCYFVRSDVHHLMGNEAEQEKDRRTGEELRSVHNNAS